MKINSKYDDLIGEEWTDELLTKCISDPEISIKPVWTDSADGAIQHIKFKNLGRNPKQLVWTFFGGTSLPVDYEMHLPQGHSRYIRARPNPLNGCFTKSYDDWISGIELPDVKFVETVRSVRGNTYTYTIFSIYNPTPDFISIYQKLENNPSNGDSIHWSTVHTVVEPGSTTDVDVAITGEYRVLERKAYVQRDSYLLS